MAGVDTRHPDYIDRLPEWELMRDANRGAEAIKRKAGGTAAGTATAGRRYLPMPSGFTAQTDGGTLMFAGYLERADFPEIVSPTIAGMVGLIHKREPVITMPSAMEPLWENITRDGQTLEIFHRKLTEEILLQGRFSILTDAAPQGSDLPFLTTYHAESLINWSEDRTLFVLDECGLVREPNAFDWEQRKQWRVLRLVDGVYQQELWQDGASAPTEIIKPLARAEKSIQAIPFVVANATDLAVRPSTQPLIAVGRAAVRIFQLDADYRHQLFMSGQETFVITGLPEKSAVPSILGAGVVLALPVGAQAMYVSPTCSGIAAHLAAMEDARNSAAAAATKMFDSSKAAEAAEALRLRFAAQTANLTTTSMSSAAALEQGLRNIAIFMGLDPKSVIVEPNLKFVDQKLTPQEGQALVGMWQSNAISYDTLYANLQAGEIASQERTAEEERTLIDEEPQNQLPDPTVVNPNDPTAGLTPAEIATMTGSGA